MNQKTALRSFISSRKILNPNLISVKRISRIFSRLSDFFFSKPGILFGRPLQYQEGRGSLCFHGLIFPQYISGHKVRETHKPSEVFQMLVRTVFRLDTNKTDTKLDKMFHPLMNLIFSDLSMNMTWFHLVPSCRTYIRRALFQFLKN